MSTITFDTSLATKTDIVHLEWRIDGVDSELKLVKWMTGAILGVAVTLLFKLFHSVHDKNIM